MLYHPLTSSSLRYYSVAIQNHAAKTMASECISCVLLRSRSYPLLQLRLSRLVQQQQNWTTSKQGWKSTVRSNSTYQVDQYSHGENYCFFLVQIWAKSQIMISVRLYEKFITKLLKFLVKKMRTRYTGAYIQSCVEIKNIQSCVEIKNIHCSSAPCRSWRKNCSFLSRCACIIYHLLVISLCQHGQNTRIFWYSCIQDDWPKGEKVHQSTCHEIREAAQTV